MITLLKKDSDIMAVRDICVETREGRRLLPKGWQGWLYAITKENGEPELFVQGKDPRSGETETYYYLDPRDFESILPTESEEYFSPRVLAIRDGRAIMGQSRTLASFFPRVTLFKEGDKVFAVRKAKDAFGDFVPKGFTGTIERISRLCGGEEGWEIPKAVIAVKDAFGMVATYLNPRDFTLVE